MLNSTLSHITICHCNKSHSDICSCIMSYDSRMTFIRKRKHFCIIFSTITSTLFIMEYAQFPTNMNRMTHRTWRDVNCSIITWNPAEVMTTWHNEILTLSLSGSGSGQVLLLHGEEINDKKVVFRYQSVDRRVCPSSVHPFSATPTPRRDNMHINNVHRRCCVWHSNAAFVLFCKYLSSIQYLHSDGSLIKSSALNVCMCICVSI